MMKIGPQFQNLDAARRWGIEQLASGTEQARREAEILLGAALGYNRAHLLAHLDAPLPEATAMVYRAWVQRRAAGEPLPYISGRIEFYGLEFAVSPAVLIPRPETELLVETALAHARPAARIADVGTGSGCIVVALASQLPQAAFYAIDLSPAALEVAQENATQHGVANRIRFLEGDLLAPLPEPVDIIVSNPPYVAEGEWEALPISVRREPEMALLAGADGLDTVRRLLAQAPARLRAGGLLLVEIGERQGAATLEVARAAFPAADCRILTDLAGKDRVLSVRQR